MAGGIICALTLPGSKRAKIAEHCGSVSDPAFIAAQNVPITYKRLSVWRGLSKKNLTAINVLCLQELGEVSAYVPFLIRETGVYECSLSRAATVA